MSPLILFMRMMGKNPSWSVRILQEKWVWKKVKSIENRTNDLVICSSTGFGNLKFNLN